jgi:hypothetical protein
MALLLPIHQNGKFGTFPLPGSFAKLTPVLGRWEGERHHYESRRDSGRNLQPDNQIEIDSGTRTLAGAACELV